MPYGQPSLPRDQWSPDPSALDRLLAMLGMPQPAQGDVRLPMEAGSQRDPRLPAPTTLDQIQEGYDTFKSMGAPKSAFQALQRATKQAK